MGIRVSQEQLEEVIIFCVTPEQAIDIIKGCEFIYSNSRPLDYQGWVYLHVSSAALASKLFCTDGKYFTRRFDTYVYPHEVINNKIIGRFWYTPAEVAQHVKLGSFVDKTYYKWQVSRLEMLPEPIDFTKHFAKRKGAKSNRKFRVNEHFYYQKAWPKSVRMWGFYYILKIDGVYSYQPNFKEKLESVQKKNDKKN